MSSLPFGSVPAAYAESIIVAVRDGEAVDTVRSAMPIEEAIVEARKLGGKFENVLVKNPQGVIVWRLR